MKGIDRKLRFVEFSFSGIEIISIKEENVIKFSDLRIVNLSDYVKGGAADSLTDLLYTEILRKGCLKYN